MTRLLAAVLAVVVAAPASACSWRVNASALGALPVGSRWVADRADLGPGLGLGVRRALDEKWTLGASYENIRFENASIRVQPLILSVGRELAKFGGGKLDLHAGLGGSNVSNVQNGRKWRIASRWGFAWDRHVTERWTLGTFVDHHWAFPRNRTGHREVHTVTAGLSVGFAPASKHAAAAPAPAAAKPADEDEDGVANPVDRCPGTPRGAAVTSYGCLKSEKVEIRLNVEFETGQDVVRAQFDAQLKEAADFLKTYAETRAAIEGHTDDVGDEAMNLDLSQRRAAAVRQALIDRFAVDAARLSAEGYGETKPLADNSSDEGRARNRRVVAVFSAQ